MTTDDAISTLQGWIDDPGDPWVGFVVERVYVHGKEEPTPLKQLVSAKIPFKLRVKAAPENYPSLPCPSRKHYRVHPDDASEHYGYSVDLIFVCEHMGRFVE